MRVAAMVVLVVSLVLNAILVVGNWNLYARVEKIETTLGLQATPQSLQTPSQPPQPRSPGQRPVRPTQLTVIAPIPLCNRHSVQSGRWRRARVISSSTLVEWSFAQPLAVLWPYNRSAKHILQTHTHDIVNGANSSKRQTSKLCLFPAEDVRCKLRCQARR